MNDKEHLNSNENHAGSSSESELDDLQCLNFPGDIDWSTTLVLRCDPAGGHYDMGDILKSIHEVVRRNDLFSFGPTTLNHVYVMSFKSIFSTEGFVKFMGSPKMSNGLKVKGHTCTFTRVPSKCLTVHVRNIPLEVDSVHIVDLLSKYGSIVKTELVKSNFRGWFHVYTNERKFTIYPKSNVTAQDLPFGINIKGLYGNVYVAERNPKYLECYYSGHKGETCDHAGCILNKGQVGV